MDTNDRLQASGPRRRITALCAVALIVLAGGLLQQMSAEAHARPVPSLDLVFGPAPAAAAQSF